MRILVTGAGGFIGRGVVRMLAQEGHEVRAFIHHGHRSVHEDLSDSTYPSTIEVITGDIREARCAWTAAAGCDGVIHLAGKAHAIDDEAVSEEEYQSTNVGGTKQLLDGAVAGGVRRFIFASSVKVFGEGTKGCVDENAPSAPQSAYARSKWAAEQLIASYAKRGGFGAVSFRLPLVYGPTHKGNLFRMVAAIDQGWFPPLPRVPTVRSMLHVKNFMLAVRAALDSKAFLKPAYVVADARPYSISEIYDRLREGLGRQPPRCRVPLWGLSLGAKCGDVLQAILRKPLPLSSAALQKLAGQACYSPAAVIRDMGYQPLYTFEAAVPEIIQHYRRAFS